MRLLKENMSIVETAKSMVHDLDLPCSFDQKHVVLQFVIAQFVLGRIKER
jgi:hypothetical protein